MSAQGSSTSGISFDRAAIVVAHPDDEILWFSSIAKRVSKIYVCFGDYPPISEMGARRRAALAALPLSNIEHLNVTESDSFLRAEWPNPKLSEFGFSITRPKGIEKAYKKSYSNIFEALSEKLAGYDTVFTHNPWGEYGHEDHGLVHCAIKALQKRNGFKMYFSNYVCQRNGPLLSSVAEQISPEYVTLETDEPLAQDCEMVYRTNNCWTWFDGYRWPVRESFLRYKIPDVVDENKAPLFPVNYLYVNLPTERRRDNVFKRRTDRLSKKIIRVKNRLFPSSNQIDK